MNQFIADAARSAAQAALDAAKGFLGIASPSKVFAGIGGDMMAGMAQGIRAGVDLPAMAMEDVAAGLERLALAPAFDLGALLPVGGLVGQDAGPARSVHYTSTTTVHTNRDPMQVLRFSRHIDQLGTLLP